MSYQGQNPGTDYNQLIDLASIPPCALCNIPMRIGPFSQLDRMRSPKVDASSWCTNNVTFEHFLRWNRLENYATLIR